MGNNYYWRHGVPTYPTYQWTSTATPPQAGAVLVSQLERIFNETPSGTIDGVNNTFTTDAVPNPVSCCLLYLNGMLLEEGSGKDYVVSGNTITFQAGAIPQTGDKLLVTYLIE